MKRSIYILLCIVAIITPQFSTAQNLHYSTTKAMGEGIEDFGRNAEPYMDVPCDGVPFLSLGVGASLLHGEYARMRACFPGLTGFTLMGGVGKEMIFNRDYKDKMSWHAGIGYYVVQGPVVVNLDILAAKSPQISDVGLGFDAEFDYFLGNSRTFGFTCNIGVGFGEFDADEPKCLWEFGVGIIVKLFKNNDRSHRYY